MLKDKDFRSLFENFRNKKVMIIGDVMVDSYLWGKVERISPEAPVPIVAVEKRENRLGGAANVSLNVKSLGATPVLFSVVGDDLKGKEFLELLDHESMSRDGIVISEGRPTTTKFRVLGNRMQMLRVDEETDKALSKKDQNRLIDRIRQRLSIDGIEAIIFQDYDKGVISSGLIKTVTELAAQFGIPVVVDPKKRNFRHYKNVTLFKPNLKELIEGTKADFGKNDIEDLKKAVIRLKETLQSQMVMVTLSEKGILICFNDEEGKEKITIIPAHIRNISDVSGAGDTVISVAALCMATRIPPEEMARLANLAGGLVCEEVGVAPVNREKLLKEAYDL